MCKACVARSIKIVLCTLDSLILRECDLTVLMQNGPGCVARPIIRSGQVAVGDVRVRSQ